MKRNVRLLLIILPMTLLAFCFAGQTDDPNRAEQENTTKAVIITCKGTIDEGLYKSIKRRSEEAIEAGAAYLVYDISTYGGMVDAADSISKYFILEAGTKVHTVAYISTEAISAGAMISVSCKDIIMLENTKIGDCAPILLGGSLEGVEREKQESFIRTIFRNAAEANGYPAALLEAMVTQSLEVYRIKNLQTGEYEFFEKDFLPDDPNVYDIDGKELIVADDKILSLTASEAFKYGIARAVVKNFDQAFDFLAERDGVNFEKPMPVLKPNWSEELVRWLNSPVVMGILVMVAMVGLYIEFNTPGIGLPGLVALICFVIIIGSKYLIGMANWVEVALFVIGLILLAIEVFVLPGFGITGTIGLICIFAGLFGMLVKNPPDRLPWPQSPLDWDLFVSGALGFILGIAGFGIAAYFLARYLPRLEFLSGLILSPSAAKEGDEVEISGTSSPEKGPLVLREGQAGRAVSNLRPAGKARFEECYVDVVAEGDFIDKGNNIKIIQIRGNRVVVKKFNGS